MLRELKPGFHQNLLRMRDALPFHTHRWLPVITLEPLDLLLAAFEGCSEPITILQIGACDGITNDPICHFVKREPARAILVEPNPYAFARLQSTYEGAPNVTLIQAAVGESDGEAYLYRLKKTRKQESGIDLSLQIASFDLRHLKRIHSDPKEIERITVPCRSLASLVSEHSLSKIHLLQIDAEGFDASLVRMALNLPSRPGCIHFEHVHLRTADRRPLYSLLKGNDYLLTYSGWNILAIQSQVLAKLKNGRWGN
jgi:FkbM family methyltransferase